MESKQVVIGQTEEEIWQQINDKGIVSKSIYECQVLLKQGSREVLLVIDIDLGGGFESGYELTQITADLHKKLDFKFAIHHEGFFDEIGKFLGMQDITTGYAEFDEKVVVKSDNEEKVKALFADSNARQVFGTLEGFTFGIHSHHIPHSDDKKYILELYIDTGITEPTELRKIYHAFVTILDALEG